MKVSPCPPVSREQPRDRSRRHCLRGHRGTTNTDLLLTVSTLTYGAVYTVTVNNVTDLAAAPNTILLTAPSRSSPSGACRPTSVFRPAWQRLWRLASGGLMVTAMAAYRDVIHVTRFVQFIQNSRQCSTSVSSSPATIAQTTTVSSRRRPDGEHDHRHVRTHGDRSARRPHDGLIFRNHVSPKDLADGKNPEFVEVYNARSIFRT